jgi:hypothetical protein
MKDNVTLIHIVEWLIQSNIHITSILIILEVIMFKIKSVKNVQGYNILLLAIFITLYNKPLEIISPV